MRKHFVVLVALSCVVATGVASADMSLAKTPIGTVNADTAELVPIRKRLALRSTAQEKFLAAAKADPRTEQAKADLAAAAKIADEGQRKAALKAAVTKWQAYRTDMLKKANIDLNAFKAQIAAIPLLTAVPVTRGSVVLPATGTTVLNATSFGEQHTYKKDCPDGSDTWKFYGENTQVNASSLVADSDCGKVSAGKGAKFELPAGVKRVEITAEWIYQLNAEVSTFGIYGRAYASTGIRTESLVGYPLMSLDSPSGPVNFPVRADKYYEVSAECDVLPYCEDSNTGTAKKTVAFDIDKPGAIVVVPYVTTGADADLQSAAVGKGLILDVKSISVKVIK